MPIDRNPNDIEFESYDLDARDEAELQAEATQREAHQQAGIPPFPLHLCPTCNYNLTGLTEFRCPECGNEFTLSEARASGATGDMSDHAADLKVLQLERMLTRFHFGLMAVALLIPVVVSKVTASNARMSNVIGTIVLLMLAPVVMISYAASIMSWSPRMRLFAIAWTMLGISLIVSMTFL